MKRLQGKKRCRAAATVELAVVMPLLLAILFGIIEYGWVFSVRQAMATASREGARVAALPGSTDEDIETRLAEVLTPLGLTEGKYEVYLTHSTPENPVEMVELRVKYSDITLLGNFFTDEDFYLVAKCSMRKEVLE